MRALLENLLLKMRPCLVHPASRARRLLPTAVTLWLIPAQAVVFTSQLVTNLPAPPGGLPCGSSPSLGAAVGGYFYFAASDGTNGTTGRELWRTDGTPGGTTLVKDINPGAGDSAPQNIIAAGTNVLFLATDGVHGQQLWKSDGTAAGTVPLTSLGTNAAIRQLLPVGSGACYWVQFGGAFSFTNILYRTDGTVDGTFVLAGPGALLSTNYMFGSLDVSGSTILYGTLDYYDAYRITNSLWSFSGDGPYTLFQLTTQPNEITYARIVGTNCYFIAGNTNYSAYGGIVNFSGGYSCNVTNHYTQQPLWRISLFGGLPQIADASPWATGQQYSGPLCGSYTGGPGFYDSGLSPITVVNQHLFYSYYYAPPIPLGQSYSYGPLLALGQSGSPATIVPNDAERTEEFIGTIGANIYYWDYDNPSTIYQTDGASAGVAALNLGSLGFTPSDFLQVNSRFFFLDGYASGSPSWAVTDLTPGGTSRCMTSSPSIYGLAEPIYLGAMGNLAFFHNPDPQIGDEPYRCDGTTTGTFLLKDIAPGTNALPPLNGVASGGIFYFTLASSDTGAELWRSDGTAPGTFLLKDIYPGTNSSWPSQLTPCNGQLYFSANDGSHGPELWRSDGTTAGTYMVKDIRPGAAGSNPTNLTACGSELFFVADDGSHGAELWVSDGTSNGTYLVQDIVPGIGSGNIHDLGASGGEVHFLAGTSNTAAQLWFSTSTPGAAQFLYDFGPSGSYPPYVQGFTAFGGKTYFAVNQYTYTYYGYYYLPSLWVTDDTPAGTAVIANNVGHEISTAGTTLFTTYGTNLFTSDGTALGTVVLTNSPAGFNQLTPLGSRMYFTSGSSLWSSDGTTNGTFPTAQFSDPTQPVANLTAFQGALIFSADCRSLGTELWATAPGQGATLIEDLSPQSGSDNLQFISAATNQVFYVAKPAGQPAWQLRTLHLQSLANPSGPFGGTPWPVPGLIEAENFDLGGEGVAYHDLTADNEGGVYRPYEGVDIDACDDTNGGFCVFRTRPGEWMDYTINAAYTGLYQIEFRMTSAAVDSGQFHLAVDGVQTQTEPVLNNGTPGSWVSFMDDIPFTAGTHVLRVAFDTATSAGDVGVYNWFNITALATNQPPAVFITFPPPNGIVSPSTPVMVTAQVVDPTTWTAPIVQLFVDGQSLGFVTNQAGNVPYSLPWTPTPGAHTASAIATDSFGASGASSNVLFFVAQPLLPMGSFWRANPYGTNLGTAWHSLSYDDSRWPRFRAPFGFGYSGIRTLTPSNYNGSPIPTFYFRTTFSNNLSTFNLASLTLNRDDAAVVWINGSLLARLDLPQPPTNVVFTNLALTNVFNNTTHTNPAQDVLVIPNSLLLDGTNLIAVEVHQGLPYLPPRDNFDMYFDLSFSTFLNTPPPLLSIFTITNSVTVQWPDSLTNWTLEHSLDLSNWNALNGTPFDTNGFLNLMFTSPLAPRDFFRLHQTNGP